MKIQLFTAVPKHKNAAKIVDKISFILKILAEKVKLKLLIFRQALDFYIKNNNSVSCVVN